ncbi:EAL domain-containing protein [Loigolactobacillus zhaoyuanensis]|uniref:EAL domain-containing protein n=1 Tax=Loigolactobacillus zhaoyuanensis TaxID=2486017 RepID=A0ABW8UIX2_9LACO|nr:EAL domain-containing protein [Loigolactobacillus zhaoyuanensis]
MENLQVAKYRLFCQGCYDKQRDLVVGYELLLREQAVGQWRVPADFSILTPQLFADLVTEAMLHLPTQTKVMVNLDHDQFIDRPMLQALIAVQQRFPQHKLIVELTERDNGVLISETDLVNAARYLTSNGLQLSLDDVGSGKNQLIYLNPLLPFAFELKFALQNFATVAQRSDEQLVFWQRLVLAEAKDFVLEGIETNADLTLADNLAVNLRQGYYYDRPHQFY